MRGWDWPAETRRVTIFADAGKDGTESAAALAEKLVAAGIPAAIRTPIRGDDFNDDLRHGETAAEYPALDEPAPPLPVAAPPATYADIEAMIGTLTKANALQQLGSVIIAIVKARLEPLPEDQLLGLLKRNTGANVSALREQLKLLKRRFNASGDPHIESERPRWAAQLRKDVMGQAQRNEANVAIALSNDEAFAGAIAFDEFKQEMVVQKRLPWDGPFTELPRSWGDSDDVRCAVWMQHRDINVSPATISRSVLAAARDNTVHPVRDYLGSLLWDGRPRLETWTMDYLGAADTVLHRVFGSLWVISAVARIMQPGAKADHILILEGPQGARKSSALELIAGKRWFTDELAELGSKDGSQQLRGVWIIELAELDALGRADVTRIKSFLSRTVDRYRPPYGRYVIDVPRQCVFAGSVNPDTYLRDETGNRRFWPIRCGAIDLPALGRARDQLWAEAAARYAGGAVWWLTDPAHIALATGEQGERYQGDVWDDRIENWLRNDGMITRLEPLHDVSISEVLQHAIGLEAGRWGRAEQMRIAAHLKAHGWERYKSGGRGQRAWRYRRSTVCAPT
jgi:predicted P-loop ATPase